MSFTTSCYIRKNTPELRKRLADLGYSLRRVFSDANLLYCIYGEVLFYYDDKHPERHAYGSGIDCGTNEELFLAIAAKRDDTSANQYWVFDQDYSPHCKKGHFAIGYFRRCSCYCHVATVEELIEHFKTKEQ